MAKLFFYSGGSSEKNESLDTALVQTIGKKGRITYIPAAHPAGVFEYEQFRGALRRLGLSKTSYCPLDSTCTERQRRDALLSEAIFLSGGNTYHFLANLRKAGMISRLRHFVRQGGVLAGLSAGSLIMTTAIDLAGLVPGESDENTFNLKRLSGLGLVEFEVFPHFKDTALSIKLLRDYSTRSPKKLIYAFPDGAGVEVSTSKIIFHHQVSCFANGQRIEISAPD